MDNGLKELMQLLGDAINESLSDSDRIATAIGDIKRAGYDVFLILEATIGFSERSKDKKRNEADDALLEQGLPEDQHRRKIGKIALTSQDQKFLRALKISTDEKGEQT